MAVKTSDKLLLSATEAAVLCGVSRSLWWSMHSAGKVPLPIRLGRRTLWNFEELRSWSAAIDAKTGQLPNRERWQAMKGVNL